MLADSDGDDSGRDDKIILVSEKIDLLKEKEVEFKFGLENHKWKGFISVNDENEPILLLFDEKIAFENLITAPKVMLYRHRRHNDFSKRVKKTSYEMFVEEQVLKVDC